MVNIAVVGAGGYAFSVIQRLVTLSDVCRLTAVTSNPQWQDAGAAWCRSRDIPVYDHLDGMLDELKGKCDVILVPTPIPTHYEIARACLAGGFDVFLEKPPVATVQQGATVRQQQFLSDYLTKTVGPMSSAAMFENEIQRVADGWLVYHARSVNKKQDRAWIHFHKKPSRRKPPTLSS